MPIKQIRAALRKKFHFDERAHAISILASDFPKEFRDLLDCLDDFWLAKTHILDGLGKGASYRDSTTQMDELIRKVDGGGADGCPLLLVGLRLDCYKPDR